MPDELPKSQSYLENMLHYYWEQKLNIISESDKMEQKLSNNRFKINKKVYYGKPNVIGTSS